jgi:predicted metal-dependent HD superfamily phosphohydrolase
LVGQSDATCGRFAWGRDVTHLARWVLILNCLGAGGEIEPVFVALKERYAEPHRAYHTFAHVRSCLKLFDEAKHLASHPSEVEAALWLHDVVYDPRAGDNEKQSARWARERLEAIGIPAERLAVIEDLILVTRHDGPAFDTDARLVADIDLAILGADGKAFDLYERQIRLEYDWVPLEAFREGRAKVLKGFLQKERIYQTTFFRERYEARARENLARSLLQLGFAHK